MVQIYIFLSLAALSAASSLQPRSFLKTYGDLKSADSDTNSVAQAVLKASSPLPPSPPNPTLGKDIQLLEYDYGNCSVDVKQKNPPITPVQVQSLCGYLSGTLFNDTRAMLNAFVAKRSQFNSAGLHNVVVQDLTDLRDGTETCIANIAAAGSGSKKREANAALPTASSPCAPAAASYSAIYASALRAYGS